MAFKVGGLFWDLDVNLKGFEKQLDKAFGIAKKKGAGLVWDTSSFVAGLKMTKKEFKSFSNEVSKAKDKYEELLDLQKGLQSSDLWGKLGDQAKQTVENTVSIAKAEADLYKRTEKFMGLGQKIRKVFGGLFSLFRRNTAKAGVDFSGFLKRLVGITSVAVLLRKAFSYAREGMQNLMKADATTANSVMTLRNALTALKNALASAFAPILNAVAPILAKFIGMLTSAANAVASFISALTGKKFAVVASGVSDGISGIGDSASGANESAKELKKTLMGFDKVNKLDSDSGGGSGGAGSSKGGGGGFDLVPVGDEANKWADKFKESWEKADFYWLGELLANKLNAALRKIDWAKINATLEKVAKSIATFLNGFIENTDWKLVGYTISNGIASAINFVATLIGNINWRALGKAIVDFIAGIDWKALFKSASKLLGTLAGAIAGVLWGAAKEAVKLAKNKIKSHFKKAFEDAGGDVVKGFFLGIGRAIVGIGKWIWNNIFKPFIDGFKQAFGISSPSKVMAEMGGYIIDGLLEGLKDGLSSVKDWFKDLPDAIQKFIGKGKKNLLELQGVVEYEAKQVGKVWKALNQTLKGISQYTAVKIGAGWSAIVATVKGVSQYVATKIGKGWDAIKATVSGISQYFAQKVGSIWSTLNQTLYGYVNYYAQKVGSAWSSLNKTLTGVVQYVAQTVSGSSSKSSSKKSTSKKSSKKKKAGGGVYVNGRWRPISAYRSGGEPAEGQLFYARENGAELVGNLNGHTAVMNNDQIVASVSRGVAKAIQGVRIQSAPPLKMTSQPKSVHDAQVQDNKELVNLLRQILVAVSTLDLDVQLDGESIKNNVVRRVNNHTRATGNLEFIL